jgi:hypothetical protein
MKSLPRPLLLLLQQAQLVEGEQREKGEQIRWMWM